MGLMRQNQELLSILRCPMTGRPISVSLQPELAFWCKDDTGERHEFATVNGQPVLIDFDKSIATRDAVLDSGGASLVEGRPAKRSLLKRIVYGTNRVETANAQILSDLTADGKLGRRPRLLVIGGGTATPGVRHLQDSGLFEVVSFDIYASTNTDFIADAHAIPVGDGLIDVVWIQAVLEHVLCPEQVVAEIERVLVPEGLVYAETPFLQPVHEKAYDFTRFTECGHRWLFRRFRTLKSGVVNGPGTTTFQILRYFAGGLLRSRKLGSLAALPFFWLRFLDRVIPQEHASDLASGVYFLGRKSDQEIAPNEMPAFYRGVR